MRQCTTDDFEGFYTSNSAQESQIKAHKDANQFWCPDTTSLGSDDKPVNDLSKIAIMNRLDQTEYNSVEIFFRACNVPDNPDCQTVKE